MTLLTALLAGGVVLALAVYILRQAAQMIRHRLEALEQAARRQVEEREALIRQRSEELLQQRRETIEQIAAIHERFGQVQTQIQGLHELQGKVGELNDLLKPQQLRGELGEVIVRNLLADKLPKQYEEEHTFSDGKKVEFAIRLNDKLIPVDSKLQLEDYKRLRDADERQRPALRTEFKRKVRQKIDEVKQYIRPQEGTTNFALMVIPSEAVFYELVASKDFTEDGGLYDYAQMQRVFLTSPLTFWAYLTTIAQGLKGLEIEHRAEEVLASLQHLAAQVRSFVQEEFRKLGGHLRNATSQYDQAEKALKDVEQALTDLERIGAPHQPHEGAIP
ncbi:MAG: DNA recombination protein RmuC [Candidatus Omnitrophica bacterium]|nr:DNA recombination protein RmuC [Candidatus Omnitrophota bacterium]